MIIRQPFAAWKLLNSYFPAGRHLIRQLKDRWQPSSEWDLENIPKTVIATYYSLLQNTPSKFCCSEPHLVAKKPIVRLPARSMPAMPRRLSNSALRAQQRIDRLMAGFSLISILITYDPEVVRNPVTPIDNWLRLACVFPYIVLLLWTSSSSPERYMASRNITVFLVRTFYTSLPIHRWPQFVHRKLDVPPMEHRYLGALYDAPRLFFGTLLIGSPSLSLHGLIHTTHQMIG